MRIKKITVPHTFVIIGIVLIFVTMLTYIVPAGIFERVVDKASGNEIIKADSFTFTKQTPVNPFEMVIAVGKGLVDASDIIFFCFFAYGLVYLLMDTGAFFAGVGRLQKIVKNRDLLIFPVFMLIFGICGSTFGMYEEVYGLIPAFIGLAIALGYDGLVGGACVVLGVVTGFAAATLNPFTIGIAQEIAGLPMGSGILFRIICFIIFQSMSIGYLMFYAHRVKVNPQLSIVQDVKFNIDNSMAEHHLEELPFTFRHKCIIFVFFLSIMMIIVGTTQFGWYLPELSAMFLTAMFIVGFIGGYNASEICGKFLDAAKDILFGAMVIGIARSLVIVMDQGNITDSVVYYMGQWLGNAHSTLAAVGMLIFQTFLNFFIPSGSGQAAVSMPIMTELSNSIGLNPQVSVLAFQFGDGFSNMFWPTVIATECGIMGLPLQKWYKFMWPLFIMMFLAQILLIIVSTFIFP